MGNEVTTQATQAWKDREHAREYLSAVGLTKNLPLFVRFYNGDQWAAATDNNKNIPRLVTNIIKMICRNKKSAILSTPVKIVCKTDSDQGAEEFTRFLDYIQKELRQDDLDREGVGSGVKKGTAIFHYYWDAEARGKKGQYPGGVRCELIDPLNAYFSNPAERDEQKQKWIMFESREELSAVREKADSGVNKDDIVADEIDSKYATKEQQGTDMVTVLTKYFRKNGEVYCEKSTRTVVVNKAFPLTPAVDAAMDEIKRNYDETGDENRPEDVANTTLPDKEGQGKETVTPHTKAYLYPVVVLNYEPREGSIYGIGEIEGLIPNQKAINLMLSMAAYNIEMTAWGKYIVDPNALKGQRITNDPGQVLYDHSKTMQGIRKLEGQQIPVGAFNIVDTVTSLTRTVTGSSEVMTGETSGANMSGAAIAQLQSQALLPVEDLKQEFWNVKKKQGLVLTQFMKLSYTDAQYTYEEETKVIGEDGKPKVDQFGRPLMQTQRKSGVFNSAPYRDADIDIVVEATAGSKASVAGDIALLDVLLNAQAITPKDYVKAYPDNTVSNKHEILKMLEEKESSAMVQLQSQAQQLAQTVQEQAAQLQGQGKVIEEAQKLIKENQELNQALLDLYVSTEEKIKNANAQVEESNRKTAEATEDARYMVQDLARMSGLM